MEKKIFVVDDDESIRKLLGKAFEKAGFTAVIAASAEEALDILKKENPQVMFLDLKLPGMNGIELCKTIRKDKPIACIYAMTGYNSIFELTECRDAGFDDYFLKPFDLSVIIDAAENGFQKIERWKKNNIV